VTSHNDGTLRRLSSVLELRDANGRPLSYSHSQALRHTKATTLLNADAPVHVVQRYLGHRSPEVSNALRQPSGITSGGRAPVYSLVVVLLREMVV
jgi:integrase